MAIYEKVTSTGGQWVRKSDLVNGSKAKIVSETNPEPSMHQNKDGSVKMQDVCKVMFQGSTEAVKVALNRANINALVDAFGSDSKLWIGKVLNVDVEKMRVAGKAVIALYLVPQGYKKIDDESGYAVIVPETQPTVDPEIPVIKDEDVDGTMMPF